MCIVWIHIFWENILFCHLFVINRKLSYWFQCFSLLYVFFQNDPRWTCCTGENAVTRFLVWNFEPNQSESTHNLYNDTTISLSAPMHTVTALNTELYCPRFLGCSLWAIPWAHLVFWSHRMLEINYWIVWFLRALCASLGGGLCLFHVAPSLYLRSGQLPLTQLGGIIRGCMQQHSLPCYTRQ